MLKRIGGSTRLKKYNVKVVNEDKMDGSEM